VTIDVEIGGSLRRVELERAGDTWHARIDGRDLSLNAARSPSGWSLLLDGDSYDVSVRDDGATLTVSVGGRTMVATVVDPRAYAPRQRGTADDGHGGVRHVVAPMPGRVVKVLVRAGDRVTSRQGLVVIEAMKMENELRSPADALVREVRVSEDASVDAGAVLVVLE
jgi:biotin carboxyl carrier protein